MNGYEGNDETTISRQCGRHHEDADELVRTFLEWAWDDGAEARHEGATAQHREVDFRQVLHRRGGVRRITAPQWKKYSSAEEFLLLRTPVNGRPYLSKKEEEGA